MATVPQALTAWDVEAVADALRGSEVVEHAARARRDGARLVQGRQDDLDLFLADTLARAAGVACLGRIHAPGASDEVHRALSAYGMPVFDDAGAALRFEDSEGPGVRSVQRLPLPPGERAEVVARRYLDTLARLPGSRQEGGDWVLGPLMTLHWHPGSEVDRVRLLVTGGLLAGEGGWLEFREVLGGEAILAAVVDYVPSLPWPVYRFTQAPAHVMLMRWFGHSMA